MNILATQYTLDTKSLEIYLAGCYGNPHCKGCHNPSSWDFNNGEPYDCLYEDKIKNKVEDFKSLINNIMIFGGEPLDQDHKELKRMLKTLHNYNIPIWIFTRYEFKNIPDFVKKYCDYIKCGRYIPELSCENNIQYGIKLATSNQKLYKKGVNYD